jgi:hypothetical protein
MSSNSNSEAFDFYRLCLQTEYWHFASGCYWQGEIPLFHSPSYLFVLGSTLNGLLVCQGIGAGLAQSVQALGCGLDGQPLLVRFW